MAAILHLLHTFTLNPPMNSFHGEMRLMAAVVNWHKFFSLSLSLKLHQTYYLEKKNQIFICIYIINYNDMSWMGLPGERWRNVDSVVGGHFVILIAQFHFSAITSNWHQTTDQRIPENESNLDVSSPWMRSGRKDREKKTATKKSQ